MATLDWMVAANFRRTHIPSRLAWSGVGGHPAWSHEILKRLNVGSRKQRKYHGEIQSSQNEILFAQNTSHLNAASGKSS